MDVFLVDDDPICREMAERFLADQGHHISIFSDARSAWIALEELGQPQYLITDWSMPEMDGLELCQRIRQSAKLKSSYIMLLSGKDQSDHLRQARRAGADDLVAKPFDLDELDLRFNLGLQIMISRLQLAEIRRQTEALTQCLGTWGGNPTAGAEPNLPPQQAKKILEQMQSSLAGSEHSSGGLLASDSARTTPLHWDAQALGRIAQVGGKPLVDRLIELFAENAPKRLEVARWALRHANAEQLEAAVHSLRSSAGNLGALDVRDLAACIEILAEREDLAPVGPLLIELEDAVGGALVRLSNARKDFVQGN